MQSGLYLPVLTRVNKILMITLAVVFLLTSLLSQVGSAGLVQFLALSPLSFFSGHLYQLFTYPLLAQGPIELLFNCLLFWFVGADLERLWGVRNYLIFLAISVIGGGAIYLLFSTLFFSGASLYLSGAAGATSALLVAFAILKPDQVFSFMLIFPMKARYFCLLLIALQLYMGFFSPAAVLAWGHLGAIFSGYLYLVYRAKIKARLRVKSRAHLRVVRPEDQDPPKYWH